MSSLQRLCGRHLHVVAVYHGNDLHSHSGVHTSLSLSDLYTLVTQDFSIHIISKYLVFAYGSFES